MQKKLSCNQANLSKQKSSKYWSFFAFSLCFFVVPNLQAKASSVFSIATSNAPFAQRMDGLSDEEVDQFMLGRSFFVIPWVEAPSATTARDGLGPIFNANTCNSCHQQQNSATPFNSNGSVHRSLVFKLSKIALDKQKKAINRLIPDSTYGTQIGINGTRSVPFEAKTSIIKHTKKVVLKDKTQVNLTYYKPVLSSLNYGPLDKETKISIRQAPAIVGAGFIEQIPKDSILALAKAQKARNDHIQGKPNWVINPLSQQKSLGRFGYKASQDSIMMQTADAAAHDMGLTNAFFPQELCTKQQKACNNAPKGRPSPLGKLDLPMPRLAAMSFYLAKQKAPIPTQLNAEQQKGQALFSQLGCDNCHHSSFKLDKSLVIHPYSDFLLHDMGEDLADKRTEFLAGPKQWKTAPLWGLGHRVRTQRVFLHDGRAKNLQEAILWHGGEAQNAQQKFTQLSKKQRHQLIQFLEAL